MRLSPLLIAAALAVGTCANVTFAQQTQPTDRGDDARMAPGDPSSGNMGLGNTGMGDSNRSSNGPQDFPQSEVQAVPVARAEAARARAEADLVQTRLHRWIDRSWDDFMNGKDYLDAAGAEKKANDAYEKERKRVLDRLMQDSSYRAVVDLIADMRDKIDRASPKHGEKPTEQQMDASMALATLKLGYSSTASAMEAAALSADQGVQDTRNKLMDAGTRMRDMRRTFARSVRRDPQFLAGQANYDQAKINRMVSATFLEGAVDARDIALNYSWYLHRWDQYQYSTYGAFGAYGYGGYGGGYGNGGRGGSVPFQAANYYSGPYMRRY